MRQRVAWGALTAVAGTAAAVVVALPLGAAGDDRQDGEPGVSASSPAPGALGTPGAGGPGTAPLPTGRTGTGGDPLTADEERRAEQLALAGDRSLRTESEGVRGRAGVPQLVSTDLADSSVSAGDDRIAEVYFYDYATDTLVLKSVDLVDNEVVDTVESTGSQPPPAAAEAEAAADLLVDSPVGAGLRQDYEAATGEELTGARQLQVQGMTYTARPGDSGGLERCGEHRCVRLFTRVEDGPWIDTRDYVIDLSERKVHHA
ncbi:hypothetical protein [Streptomyces synnematoformans]|uniref:Tat pathway signal sequence domain protein n=1 Tax=Streptomyces synnematoformans TaxID=415721 RepID=A0ABN2A9K8_9ACTN